MAIDKESCGTWSWPPNEGPTPIETRSPVGGDLVMIPASAPSVIGRGRSLYRMRGDTWVPTVLDDRIDAAIDDGPDHVIATTDGTIMRCPPDGGPKVVFKTGVRDEPWVLGITTNGPVALTVVDDTTLRLFTPEPLTFRAPDPITAFTLSRNGMNIVAGTSSGWVGRLNRRKDELTWNHSAQLDSAVTELAFAPDYSTFAAGCQDGTVHVLNVSGGISWTARLSDARITMVAVSGRPTRLVALDENGVVHWATREGHGRLSTETLIPEPPRGAHVTALVRYEDHLLVGAADGSLTMADLTNGPEDDPGSLEHGPIRDIAVTLVGNEITPVVATDAGYHLIEDDIVLDPSSAWAAQWFRTTPSPPSIGLDKRLVEVIHQSGALSLRTVDSRDSTPFGLHKGCAAVHCAHVMALPTAFTGGADGVLLVWDLKHRKETHTVHIGRPIWRIDSYKNRLLVAAGGELLCFEHVSLRGP